MKKLLTIVLASALVFAMVAPATAAHFDLNGQSRVRSWVLGNYVNGDSSSEFVDQRLRLTGVWGITEGVKLVFRADVLEGFWGNTQGAFTETLSTDPVTGDTTTVSAFGTTSTKSAIAFDQVYGSFVLPGTPITVTLGRQPVTWGTGIAAKADNRDRLKIIVKGPVTFGLLYDKFNENFEANSVNDSVQDNQGFGAIVVGSVAGFKGGLLGYYNSNKATPGSDTQAYIVDGFVTGAAGPVALKFDLGYRFGETDAGNVTTDLSGIIAYASASLNAGMVNIGLEAAYARAHDPDPAENEGAFSHDYDGPFHSIILFHNFDYNGFAGTTRASDRGVNNALAVKGSVTAKPAPKLTLIGAAVWAQRDQVADGMDEALGIELDAIAVYNLYDNLSYTLGFGYLLAGDNLGDIDDPWGVLNRIMVKF